MQLTDHFSWDEAVFSSTALRLGIKNDIPATLSDNVFAAANGMEAVRALLGQPVHVDSWYRCAELNHAVGGASASAHMLGYAVDFTCGAFGTPLEICKAIAASDIRFDKCIQEGQWVHISFDPKASRMLMTAHFDANGKPTYTGGLS
jgi:putative chitinase